jgi:hypothetical protein
MPVAPVQGPARDGRSQAAPSSDLSRILGLLHTSIYPEARENAVNALQNVNWQTNPQVVQSLLAAARQDESPAVRAACVRCLAKLNVNTVPVVSTVQALRADADPRVQYEAEQALARLASDQAVQRR